MQVAFVVLGLRCRDTAATSLGTNGANENTFGQMIYLLTDLEAK